MTDQITLPRSVVEQALSAIENLCGCHDEPECVAVDLGKDSAAALRAALAAQQAEPVAWMFQHEDTGLMQCVDIQQVQWGFEKNNPRWKKVCPLIPQKFTQNPGEPRQA